MVESTSTLFGKFIMTDLGRITEFFVHLEPFSFHGRSDCGIFCGTVQNGKPSCQMLVFAGDNMDNRLRLGNGIEKR